MCAGVCDLGGGNGFAVMSGFHRLNFPDDVIAIFY